MYNSFQWKGIAMIQSIFCISSFFIYKKTLTYRWQISGFDQNLLMEEECFVDSKDSQKIHSGVQN